MKKALITGITGQDGSYLADLLLVDGDPLTDIKRLQRQDALLMIMKDGALHKAP